MHERPSMNVTLCLCLSSAAFGWVGVVWLPLSQLYDLGGQLSFDTWNGAGLSHFVLIFGQADLLSLAFSLSQQELWLERLGAKFLR